MTDLLAKKERKEYQGINITTVFSSNTPDKSRNPPFTLNVFDIHHIPPSFQNCAPFTFFSMSFTTKNIDYFHFQQKKDGTNFCSSVD